MLLSNVKGYDAKSQQSSEDMRCGLSQADAVYELMCMYRIDKSPSHSSSQKIKPWAHYRLYGNNAWSRSTPYRDRLKRATMKVRQRLNAVLLHAPESPRKRSTQDLYHSGPSLATSTPKTPVGGEQFAQCKVHSAGLRTNQKTRKRGRKLERSSQVGFLSYRS